MNRFTSFDELVDAATSGRASPYAYQRRLADEGLPDLLRAPTASGKTLAAVLPWLYRRLFHPHSDVRAATPCRLVLVLPQRSLVEQTVDMAQGWLGNLRLEPPVAVHVLMGGGSTDDRAWKMHPADEAIFVGTQDMILSRLLLRGYAEQRAAWPVAFGLLHASSQFVFDEVQLMGPALPTSLQLDGLRGALGTAMPCASMWMSATIDPANLATVDYPGPSRVVEIGEADRTGPLLGRLEATRRIERGEVGADPKGHARAVADLVLARHKAGTRSIAIANTVGRATAVYDELAKAGSPADLVLLHSRFRPADRKLHALKALADPGSAGLIVVATQVLEAGIDVSSRLLVTEVAPWSSIVQRAGRCNRAGEYDDAEFVWVQVPTERGSEAPYDAADLAHSTAALAGMDGASLTGTDLQNSAVHEERPEHPVLRRRDLLDLFDTGPDLVGNDLDVSRWIRDPDSTTASIAWRMLGPDGLAHDAPFPGRDELCPVPLKELRDYIAGPQRRAAVAAWVFDQTSDAWRKAQREDARPGAVLVLDSASGGYLPDRGWAPASRASVEPATFPGPELPDAVGSDHLSANPRWVPLAEHLAAVGQQVECILTELHEVPGLTPSQRAAAVLAGLYHDIGKAHPVFATSLRRAAGEDRPPPDGGPWAKSPTTSPLRHQPKYFRHELAGALAALDPASGLLEDVDEPVLLVYLLAAHHGKVRLTVRPMPEERGTGRVLGVAAGDDIPSFTLPDGRRVNPPPLRLDRFVLGTGECGDSWQTMACSLRDRRDLGPFRVAFLEAVVRMADWRASADHEGSETR